MAESEKKPFTLSPDRRIVALLLGYGVLNAAIAVYSAARAGASFTSRFYYLDAVWYTHIAAHGYAPATYLPDPPNSVFAFFPLWPLVQHALGSVAAPFGVPSYVAGALLSLLLFASCVLAVSRPLRLAPGVASGCPTLGTSPQTWLGLVFFVLSPGAWVFATDHTESLFLALSWASLAVASGATRKAEPGEPRLASIVLAASLAGLAALTRNQGVVVAVATALALAGRVVGQPWRRLQVFAAAGLVAGAFYALWPLYQWRLTGDPLISVAAQANWHIIHGFGDYVSNFFWLSPNNGVRAGVFWVLLGTGVRLLRRRQTFAFGAYVLLSLALWPLQGNSFPQAYRFGAVLFPAWFALGDGVDRQLARVPPQAQPVLRLLVVALLCLWGSAISTYYFAQESPAHWPY